MRVFAGSSPEPSTTCTPAMGRPAAIRWSVTTRAPASVLPSPAATLPISFSSSSAVPLSLSRVASPTTSAQGCRVDGGQRRRLRRGRCGAGAAADHHPPLRQQVHEQLGRRGSRIGRGIGPVVVGRVDDVAVVDGEGRQRPRLAVAAVAGRPRRHVAHRVVAAVVAQQRAPDLAQAGGGHAVGERLQRGARLGRAREAAPTQSAVASRGSPPPTIQRSPSSTPSVIGATARTSVRNRVSGPSSSSATTLVSTFWLDAGTRGWSALAARRGCGHPRPGAGTRPRGGGRR